jgi:hypothetical protein
MTSTREPGPNRLTRGPAAGRPGAASAGSRRPAPARRRAIAALMGFEAFTLAVVSTLHLSLALGGGSRPFNPRAAGIAEAVIGITLAAGLVALRRGSRRGRRVALAATAFAIVGFLVGLTFTVQGGDPIDVAYHAVMLPVLVVTAIALLWRPRGVPPGYRARAEGRPA